MEVKSYKKGDEVQILDLFKRVFKKDLSLQYWNWRFLENPATKEPMIYLMWDGDKLVGHYAVSPVHMLIDGKKVLTALSMTTMTHPEYGGRGIFSDLATGLYKEISEQYSVEMVWGFPNNNSHYGFIKNLQWSDNEIIPTMVLNPLKFKKDSSHSWKKIETFTDEHSKTAIALFESLGYNYSVYKSPEYLNWRLVTNPSASYTTWGLKEGETTYFITTKLYKGSEGAQIDIVEMVLPFDMVFIQSALTQVVNYYEQEAGKIDKLNLWIPLQDKRRLLLEKLGFIIDVPLTYLGKRSFMGKSMSNSWFYSMSDSDVF